MRSGDAEIERVTPALPAVRAKKRSRWVFGVAAVVVLAAGLVAGLRFWMMRPEVVANAAPAVVAEKSEAAAPVKSEAPVVAPVVPVVKPSVMRVELDATEPTWISVTDEAGGRLAVGLLEPGKTRTLELDQTARVRTGNAGGLIARLNGKDLGTIGPHGKVRVIEFKDGEYTITAPE